MLGKTDFAAKPSCGSLAHHSVRIFFTDLGESDSQPSHPLGDCFEGTKEITITGKIVKLSSLINILQKYFYYNSSE